jgi:hypothetical protein
MAHTPLKMTIPQAQKELDRAWTDSYSPARIAEVLASLEDKSVGWRIYHFILRICFRGIYFEQMGAWNWTKVIAQNRRTILRLCSDSISEYRARKRNPPSGAVANPV